MRRRATVFPFHFMCFRTNSLASFPKTTSTRSPTFPLFFFSSKGSGPNLYLPANDFRPLRIGFPSVQNLWELLELWIRRTRPSRLVHSHWVNRLFHSRRTFSCRPTISCLLEIGRTICRGTDLKKKTNSKKQTL